MKPESLVGRVVRVVGRRVFPEVSVSPDGVSVDELALVGKVVGSKEGPDHVMIDVGAHYGTALGPFVERGWSVIAFEPDSKNRAELTYRFGHHSTVTIDPRAVSDLASSGQSLFRSSVSSGISSLLPFHDSHELGEEVQVTTLAHVYNEYELDHVDLLKIDVEGMDLLVLKGNDWEKLTPDIVVCEFEDRKTLQIGYRFDDLWRFLKERSYHLVVSEWYPIRKYGIRHRFKRAALRRLSNSDSWGNVIATRSRLTQIRLFLSLWIGSTLGRIARPLLTRHYNH